MMFGDNYKKSGYRPGVMKQDAHLEMLWNDYKKAESTTERTMIWQRIEDHLRMTYPKVR